MTGTVANTRLHAILLTALAMVAFAGNSLLCRMALYDASIDPASFTTIRFLSGAVALSLILLSTGKLGTLRQSGGWVSAAVLVFYAITFSYAYVSLGAGTGALILFGCVQGTMIVVGLWRGDRPGPIEWLGWLIAFGGLAWLMLPGIEAPPLTGAALMAAAGVGWGLYSIRGQSESDPIASNATNFILSVPFFVALVLATWSDVSMTPRGVWLAVISGALTSGIGYIIWYAALDYLTAMNAALVQLSVPVIAAIGGVAFLAEPVTTRLTVSTALVLGGISIALVRRLHSTSES